jgi:hypothetical protein
MRVSSERERRTIKFKGVEQNELSLHQIFNLISLRDYIEIKENDKNPQLNVLVFLYSDSLKSHHIDIIDDACVVCL